MALRPVSELGLVDLTDLASPAAASPTKRRRTDAGTPKKSSRGSERSHAKPRAASRASRHIESAATQVVETPRASRALATRTVAEQLGISVTCVVAGAAGILLGRAAIRR